MLARCIRAFLDIETGDMREVGEEFAVTPERLSAINSTRYGQLAVEVEESPSEEPTAPKRTKRRTRGKTEE